MTRTVSSRAKTTLFARREAKAGRQILRKAPAGDFPPINNLSRSLAVR